MAGAWPILTKLTLARRIAVRFAAPNLMKSLFSRWYSYRIEGRTDGRVPHTGRSVLVLAKEHTNSYRLTNTQ